MNFEWSRQHVEFRARVRAFIADRVTETWEQKSGLDIGSDYTVAFSRQFCAALAAEGLLVPHWPTAYGGSDLDRWHHWILNEEMFWAGEPRGYQYMSVNWAGPAIIKCGSEDQKKAILPKIAAGNFFFCQGFSEPNAGSDLASLKTRADPDGPDGFRLNGQKIWTSAASFSDYIILLARTGGGGRAGISLFLVPMDTPGITVRVIPGLQGSKSFHEVFFDDVAVTRQDIIGEENGGWSVLASILHDERIGIPRYMLALRAIERAVCWLEARGRLDAAAGGAAALARVKCEAARLQCYKVIDDRVKNMPPSVMTALARCSLIDADQQVSDFIGRYLIDCVAANDDPIISSCYKRTAATGIASGTKEMQLNMIARDLLHLPKG